MNRIPDVNQISSECSSRDIEHGHPVHLFSSKHASARINLFCVLSSVCAGGEDT